MEIATSSRPNVLSSSEPRDQTPEQGDLYHNNLLRQRGHKDSACRPQKNKRKVVKTRSLDFTSTGEAEERKALQISNPNSEGTKTK